MDNGDAHSQVHRRIYCIVCPLFGDEHLMEDYLKGVSKDPIKTKWTRIIIKSNHI